MYPAGIFFIIFPLNLINPHPVMNLEISIKHTITNQCRAGRWWLLAVCWRFVWLSCFICSGLASPCPSTAFFPGEVRQGLLEGSCKIAIVGLNERPFYKASAPCHFLPLAGLLVDWQQLAGLTRGWFTFKVTWCLVMESGKAHTQ
jgi:hypothetical protein